MRNNHNRRKPRLLSIDFSVIDLLNEHYKKSLREEMLLKGLTVPDDLFLDGKMHRFNVDDADQKQSGWYVLRPDGSANFGNWKSDEKFYWKASVPKIKLSVAKPSSRTPPADSESIARQLERSPRSRAIRIWNRAQRASAGHRYLRKKGIRRHCARQSGNKLLVPLRDVDGQLGSIHFIDVGGEKRNLTGCSTKALFCRIGPQFGESILITEGFATAASAAEATGLPALAAVSASNLLPVGEALRNRYPRALLVFIADNDHHLEAAGKPNVGKEAANQAAKRVGGIVVVPTFDGLKGSGGRQLTDVNDLACVAGLSAVRELIEDAIAKRPSLCALDYRSFLAQKFPPREFMLHPWLTTQSLTLLYAKRGMGKTFMSLGIAYAVAAGCDFLNWKSHGGRYKVLFVDGEMPSTDLQKRLKLIKQSMQKVAPADSLRIISPDLQPNGMPDLATTYGRDMLDSMIGDADLVILDNLSALFRGSGRENDSETWTQMAAWAIQKRSCGVSVLFIHHAGKNSANGPRGHSGREDVLDTTIVLKKPTDYKEGEGARFNIVYEKNRSFWGADAAPFEVKISLDSDGKLMWITGKCSLLEDEILNMHAEGLPQRKIAEKSGTSLATVNRTLQKARQTGRLTEGKSDE